MSMCISPFIVAVDNVGLYVLTTAAMKPDARVQNVPRVRFR